ncbi:MAG TPA: (d)CMP kinase [Anaerolineaceae bacterium]|nr:(d)CMP kinase [Anaerolineaceae bacterium]
MNSTPSNIVIAIDGPAASGKSTLALILAARLGFLYFDTGVMYRAVTLSALDELKGVEDEGLVTALAERIMIDVQPPSKDDGRTMDVLVDGADVTWKIRKPRIDRNVSVVSAYGGVRTAMTEQQRRIGSRGNVVMVGRDIGTVVFPHATYKIYLDASAEERARRRYTERIGRGEEASYDQILADIKYRDGIDSSREIAPLVAAEDAFIINTDGKTIEQVVGESLRILNIKPKNGG